MGMTRDERERFDRDGYVVVRGVVEASALAAVRDACTSAVDDIAAQWHDAGLLEDVFADEPFETRWAKMRSAVPPKLPTSWRQVLAGPGVYSLWQTPAVLDRARDLLGDELYAHGVWNGRPREPGTEVQRIGWHQDAHYYKDWKAEDPMLLSVWMPLVPVTADMGALQFLPGTQDPRTALPTQRGANNLIEIVPEALPEGDPVTIECEPGDAVFFTDTTVHQALPNRSEVVRWSIDIRYGPATDDIIAKGSRGYVCASTDPDRVEDVDTWLRRYAAGGEYEAGADGIAEVLGVHRTEVTTF